MGLLVFKSPSRLDWMSLVVNLFGLLDDLVELIAKLQLQVCDVVVACIEVPEFAQLPLKCSKRTEILPRQADDVYECAFEGREDSGFAFFLEYAERNVELFLRKLPRLGKEQGNENVTVPDGLVVFILQSSFRYRIKKVFPANNL